VEYEGSEMREKERIEREEILSENGRKIRRMKEICKRRERIQKEKGGDRKKINFLLFLYL
jgi:hypothetical protein